MRTLRPLLAALLMLTLAACTSDDEQSSPEGSQTATSSEAPNSGIMPGGPVDPVAGGATLPESGECWNLSAQELDEGMAMVSSSASPVECGAEHNSITVAVAGVPPEHEVLVEGAVASGQAVDPGHEANWRSVVTPACSAAWDQAFSSAAVDVEGSGIASSYKASTLHGYAWLPTAEEWNGGARWVRCDIANTTAEPVSFETPTPDLGEIPDELIACLNANAEGYLAMPCDDSSVNGQALVTIVLDTAATQSATQDYEAFSSQAATMCADAVQGAFPDAGKEGKAALPIAFSFTGRFDCYVDRAPDDPLLK